jgi:hypothetical protein
MRVQMAMEMATLETVENGDTDEDMRVQIYRRREFNAETKTWTMAWSEPVGLDEVFKIMSSNCGREQRSTMFKSLVKFRISKAEYEIKSGSRDRKRITTARASATVHPATEFRIAQDTDPCLESRTRRAKTFQTDTEKTLVTALRGATANDLACAHTAVLAAASTAATAPAATAPATAAATAAVNLVQAQYVDQARAKAAKRGRARGIHSAVVLKLDRFFSAVYPEPEQAESSPVNVIFFADAPLRSGQKGKVGHSKVPLRAIVKTLARDYVVVLTREHYTSQFCAVCASRLADPYAVLRGIAKDKKLALPAKLKKKLENGCWKLRVCTSAACAGARAEQKEGIRFAGPARKIVGLEFRAARVWNRDINAALNVLRVGLAAVFSPGAVRRPAYLTKAYSDAHTDPPPPLGVT